jgi:oxalate decarboxylase/phosphoglucose isomerase-like protein (cupin superfamily)
MEARELPVTSPYKEWLKCEGLPVLGGFFIEDVGTVEVVPWRRKGALGAYVRLEGTDDWTGAYVCEIPPGRATHSQRHIFEEMIFVVKGVGATTVWQEGGPSQTFEWHPGSLFAIPLNAWHRHFNSQGGEPARYLAVTNLPLFMNLLREPDFIFSNPFRFTGRFDGEPGYFKDRGQLYRRDRTHYWESNFIADIHEFVLQPSLSRGAGGSHIEIMLAQNSMGAHISEFPAGRYKKAHRHGPGAHVAILTGEGYSLLWEAGKEKIRVDWKPGSVVVPPNQWFHQHFNTSNVPARYLALRFSGDRYQVTHIDDGASTNQKEGGSQIEYEDEDPEIHRMFHEALSRSGMRCGMAH